jgi:hypothetical protein
MKNLTIFILFFIIGFIIFNRLFFYKKQDIKNEIRPKTNDCYIFQFKGQNPFKTYRIDTIKILEIKVNYLKYKQNDDFISSDEIDYILKYSIKTDSCN